MKKRLKNDQKHGFVDYKYITGQKEVKMPKIYSSDEKENIRKILIMEAERMLFHGGIESTTVDSLVKSAGIPKGTFYLFFPSKEELFLEVLVSFRSEMENVMLSRLQELDENHIVTSLTEVFSLLMENIYNRGIYRLYDKRELNLIARKTGYERIYSERNSLFSFFREIFSYFAIDDEADMESFCSAFMVLQYALLSSDEIKDPLKAMRTLLRGLMLQLVGE